MTLGDMPKSAKCLKERMSDGGFYSFNELHCKRYTLAILEMFGEAYQYWDQNNKCIKWCSIKPLKRYRSGLGVIDQV